MSKKKGSVPVDEVAQVEEPQSEGSRVEEPKSDEKYLRALADYQNLEKRMGVAVEQARQRARAEVIGKFIGVLDDLEKAEIFVQDPGLKMVMDSYKAILKEAGVEEMELVGTTYDPYISEAIEVVPAGEGQMADQVVEVVRKGYRMGDVVIRPAHVKVTTG